MNVQSTIENILNTSLEPTHLVVENESHTHNVPADSETHFKLTVASSEFEGLRRVQRHQRIYALLADQLKPGGVHALAMHLYTQREWAEIAIAPTSPDCMGGSQS